MFGRLPLHPFLFAAYAVLFLYAENLSEVLLVDIGAPLGRAVLGAAAAVAGFGLRFRSPARGALVASAAVVAFFAYGHVAGLLGPGAPEDRTQLAGWGLLILAAAIVAARARSVVTLTGGLNVVALVLVVLVGASLVPYELERAARRPGPTGGTVQAGEAATTTTRDIYYLVFDRYGSADAIERRFGITGNDLDVWLADRGFHVPADSRANYRATDFSLASSLNMTFLTDLTEQVGRESSDRTPARDMLQEHAVGRFLKDQGYRYTTWAPGSSRPTGTGWRTRVSASA